MDASAADTATKSAALLQLPRGARILVLADPLRAASYRARAPNATVVTDASRLEGMEGEFDAAILDGLLEHERWDRWLLQRVHRLLRMDAPIVVIVPPLISFASVTDFTSWAYLSKQLLRRLLRRPGLELPGPACRRYHLPWLLRKLQSAGYARLEPGPEWAMSARAAGGSWLARRSTITARKAPGMAELPAHGWPDAEARHNRYIEQFAGITATRDTWLRSFPEFRAAAPRPIDASRWHEARVLVLAPHPDDELIGCGGTLCRLLSAGAQACIVLATDGSNLESLCDLSPAARKTARLQEAARVAGALGARLVLWREPDGRLQCSDETIARLAALLKQLRPSHVFTPFVADWHADHRTLSRILGRALGRARLEPRVLQYEVWSLVPANAYCDITDQAKAVERLLLLYERALRTDNFIDLCQSRNLAHALEFTGRPAYVEAFLSTTGAEFARLAERSA